MQGGLCCNEDFQNSPHVAELKYFKHFKNNSNPPRRITSMQVDDPDLDAFESANGTQLRARELGKIEAVILNLWPNAPVPESMGISSHDNAPRESQCCASSHEQSDLDESPDDLEKSTERIFHKMDFSRVSFLLFRRMEHR